jgi:deoxyribonuclease (pyrimidine dimer)
MTRINSSLDPGILLDQHLMAEYRELPMVFAALKRSLRTKQVKNILESIPPAFTLNSGHVTFFYNKLVYLLRRYDLLKQELSARGFALDSERAMYSIKDYPVDFHGDWVASYEDDALLAKRICEKYKMKPAWYKYYREPIEPDVFELLYKPYQEKYAVI